MTISSIATTLAQKVIQNGPAILTGIGVAGTVVTGVLAARAGIRSYKILQEESYHRGFKDGEIDPDMTNKEKFLLVWPELIPPSIALSATIVCVISAQSINAKRNAVLMSLYTVTDRAYTELKGKTQEVIGEKKMAEIEDEIAKDRIANHKPEDFWNNQIQLRGDGVGICYDTYSDRYFVSSRNEIDAAVNATNAEINLEGDVALNFFYDQIGLGRIPIGDAVGWSQQTGLLVVQYTYVPGEDGSPCQAVTFKRQPEHDFHRVWR